MAEKRNTTHASPMQPGLRAYIVYESVPEGCFACPVTDNRCEPIVRPGEFVIVDPRLRDPEPEELFLFDWGDGERRVRVPFKPVGAPPAWDELLFVGGLAAEPVENLEGDVICAPVRWAAGVWTVEGLREKAAGQVVGILATPEPVFGILE